MAVQQQVFMSINAIAQKQKNSHAGYKTSMGEKQKLKQNELL